jgi:hypothetical protein
MQGIINKTRAASIIKKMVPAYTLFLIITFTGTILSSCGEAPAVPHEIASESAESCRKCHQDKNSGAPQVSHAERNNCLKCHDGKKAVAYERNSHSPKEIKL